ncbi:MAG: fumarylacetoacetate hydrolase family protein [Gammaproteobacteria bacterium]|nr:fumarylacetoacetate hydrolase family protein [Gammaproteobacteria bacterium]
MNRLSLDTSQVTPAKIVCVGRNYLEHIRELGNATPTQMVVFNKPNSAISERLYSQRDGESLHYEGEICFLVRDGQLHAVGFGLDLTRRELQSTLKAGGLPWERAKAFDGAACFSSFTALGDTAIASLRLELEINGELRQQGGYELMMHKPDAILADIAAFMTLHDDDVIMTGTPQGVGQVAAGDRFVGRILSGDRELVSQAWVAE